MTAYPDGEGGLDPALSARMRTGGAVAVGVGDLREGLTKKTDVVGRGVRPGVARSQDAGEGRAGAVEEAEHRVIAEAAFVDGGALLPLGVAGDKGAIDVQDQARSFTPSGARCGYAASGLVGLQPGGRGGGRRGRTRRAGHAHGPVCGRFAVARLVDLGWEQVDGQPGFEEVTDRPLCRVGCGRRGA